MNARGKVDLKCNVIESDAPKTTAVPTFGEFFPDGTLIEMIRGEQQETAQLMLWDGKNEIVGSRVKHDGRDFELGVIHSSILRELALPAQCIPYGTTREFLNEICTLITNFVGLDENSARLVGRIVLCSSLIEASPVAPTLRIVGPDATRGNRLMALLRCLCRHSLPLAGVTPAGFCSLPSGAKFTYLIDHRNLSDKLLGLFDDASSRDRKIPSRGRLLDLFGVQIFHIVGDELPPLRAITISMTPTGQVLPTLDLGAQQRITNEIQGKLLGFRRANLAAAADLQFEASKFSLKLQDLAKTLAAATPDDVQLQDEVFNLLRDQERQVRSDAWVNLSTITMEAVLVAYHDSPGGFVYVSDLADIAQEFLTRRGEDTEIDDGSLGKRLKSLGFMTERDAKGSKLHLTQAALNHASQLAKDLGVCDSGNCTEGKAGM
jgi:hypothetical protein